MENRKSLKLLKAGVIILACLSWAYLLFPSMSQAASSVSADYYKGKTVEVIVPYTAGGGADIWARFVSIWLPKYIQGSPTLVVRNMPGANALIGANYVYNVAKKDGLTMMGGSGGCNLNSLLQLKGVEFDMDKMPMVLASSTGIVHYVKGDLIKSFKDIYEKELIIYGHLPPGGSQSTTFILIKELLGFKTKKIILSYGGSGDARRAFIAGELNACSDTVVGYASQIKPLEAKGEVKILWQTGTIDKDGNIVRVTPLLSHVPTAYERYEEIYGKPPSGKVLGALKTVMGAVIVFDKSVTFPPGTPPAIVTIVSKACQKMVKDPQFTAAAQAKVKTDFVAGEEMEKTYEKTMIQADPEAIAWLRGWLKKEWKVE